MRSKSMIMIKAVLLGVLLLSPFLGKSNDASASSAVASGKAGYAETSALKSQNYTSVPSAAVSAPVPNQTIFGAELDSITSAGGLDQMVTANASWTRRNAVLWSDVEPTEGTYNWSVLAGLEGELQNASSKGIEVILIVRGTPSWAQKVAGSSCGPIKATKLAAFGSFMHELVVRYSVAPYNVKYWELWNEEDVDPTLVSNDSIYGCWGDKNDAYYGGGYYADMLKVVYPQIKSTDPQAQVLVGGLLMYCDPRPGTGCAAVNASALPGKFLEGILLGGGGPYFDGVSFHAYDFYQNQLGQYSNPMWQSAWNKTGPAFIAKAQFIRSVLSQYGVTGKFLMNTEVALICELCSNDATFETTKAYYVTQAYAAAIAQDLRANIWYSLLGAWGNTRLLNSDLSPRPAYTAFQFSRNELQDAIGVRDITEYTGVKGYELQRGNRRIWVLAPLDGNTHLINLPSAPLAAWDALGNSVSPAASMNMGLNPLYLEWNISFTDIPVGYWAASWIERLYADGVTGGCATTPSPMYCPEASVTRAQMAVFILRSKHGPAYLPPAATGTVFTDVSTSSFAADWIEQLAAESITGGCSPTTFCPNDNITRAEMAVFLLRGKHDLTYIPPAATGTLFTDVPASSFAAAWIEQLAAEGITGGCSPTTYCPSSPVTRAEMAVFLVKTFNLP